MSDYLADTHAIFWYLIGSPNLGKRAKAAFDECARGEGVVYIPAIVLAELYFLNEKAGRPLDFQNEYQSLVQSGQFEFVPFEPEHVLDFAKDTALSENA